MSTLVDVKEKWSAETSGMNVSERTAGKGYTVLWDQPGHRPGRCIAYRRGNPPPTGRSIPPTTSLWLSTFRFPRYPKRSTTWM
jgi:hypothetical protein